MSMHAMTGGKIVGNEGTLVLAYFVNDGGVLVANRGERGYTGA